VFQVQALFHGGNSDLPHPLTLYDLMLHMFRRLSMLVLVIAALTAVEPLLHHHPLQQDSIPSACAICATGVGRLPAMMPALAAPQIVVYTLASAAVVMPGDAIEIALPSRAPPAV
jgi:hypothetical protein